MSPGTSSMSSQCFNPNEPHTLKCQHVCFNCDLNYCPTCREAGNGEDFCISGSRPCLLCGSFFDVQKNKILDRICYQKKSQKSDTLKRNRIYWMTLRLDRSCDLDLTFDLAVVTLTYKILSGLYLRNRTV